MMKRKVHYPDGEPRLEQEGREIKSLEMHNSNLFDENEDNAGEKVDLATGRPINNSTATSEKLDRLSVLTGNQIFDGKEQELDDAEKWLRENDPSHPRYVGKEQRKAE